MIKSGVRTLGIRPEIVLALAEVRESYASHGQLKDFVITSVVEGAHKRASLHYTGAAADLRRPVLRADEIVADAKGRLGDDFDIVLEGDHLHLEWQPKIPY